MKVMPLGISSGKPTLRRNVSALAVAREAEWLLFDCGEGTQMQIGRAGLNPSRLAAVFITHLHGDHFNGLSGLLSTMGLDRRVKDLSLVGPAGISEYLDVLARLKILYVNYPLRLSEYAEMRRPRVVYDAEQYAVSALELDHRVFDMGYRVEERPRPGRFDVARARELGVPEGPLFGRLQSGHAVHLPDGRRIEPQEVLGPARPGKSVAYCTDTRPCDASVELARGVDLLIHEATFTEELSGEAREFGHSTAAQAARIAKRAGVRRLLITHFSTRYPDPSQLLTEARAIFPETALAEELVAVEV
jgi:ribonuclease Z